VARRQIIACQTLLERLVALGERVGSEVGKFPVGLPGTEIRTRPFLHERVSLAVRGGGRRGQGGEGKNQKTKPTDHRCFTQNGHRRQPSNYTPRRRVALARILRLHGPIAAAEDQMLKIWGRTTSSNVQKVLWTCAELNIAYDRVDHGGPFGGNRDPEYLRLNPNGLVPTVIDGDLVMWESNTICRYLCTTRNGESLYPRDPVARTHVERW